MKIVTQSRIHNSQVQHSESRRGAFLILALVCFVACLGFVCFSVDVGYIDVQKTRMQNAVDAAALAAAQEITIAVQNLPPGAQSVSEYSLQQAREVAAKVADLNGVYVDPQKDVKFGTRSYNENARKYLVTWNTVPANVVEVKARRTEDDPKLQDGKLRLFFAGIFGNGFSRLTASAISYIEARDIVVVHDFSRSMNFDSQFSDESTTRLSDQQIENNLRDLWTDMNLRLGKFQFEPEYLTLTDSSGGVTSSCTFKYDAIEVTSGGRIKDLVIRYTSGSAVTLRNINQSIYDGTPARNRDVSSVDVTSEVTEPGRAYSETVGNITTNIAANRRSASLSVPAGLKSFEVTFKDGSRAHSQTWTRARAVTSHSYTAPSGKEIAFIRAQHWNASSTWYSFNPPASAGDLVTHTFSDTNANIVAAFGLGTYPFPGNYWDSYISHCKTYQPLINRGYREKYGGLNFANYVVRMRSSDARTPILGQCRHYPFTAIKEGHSLLCDSLGDLGYGDHLAMVSFDSEHRVEDYQNKSGIPFVNIRNKPITDDYVAIDNLMKYKQANHYTTDSKDVGGTNMGGGLREAINLIDRHGRAGARPTILLMTDGNANVMDRGESGTLPQGWNWNRLLDYDGDGSADYTTSNNYNRHVLKTAYEASEKGYIIHTMSVGMDGDRDLMRAVAHIGRGTFINVPGGVSVSDMEDQVKAAFHKIAAYVPPPKLLIE